MADTWQSRDVSVVIPRAAAVLILERARQWDIATGGHFDARSSVVLIWSTPPAFEVREPISCFSIQWHTPTETEATIWRLEWDPLRGGTEAEVWRAIETLAGQPLTPDVGKEQP